MVMEVLDKLAASLDGFIEHYNLLKKDNEQLQAALAALTQEKTDLEEQNRLLLAAVAEGERMRHEALLRIDILMHKIEEHDKVG